MRTRRLGAEGPDISVIGFGAWEAGKGAEWGEAPPDDQIVRAMHAAFDAGIDWIDTAEVYGKGTSERLVAQAMDARRDELTIATKVAPTDEGTGFLPEQVRTACQASLGRLGTDRIDLYQLHWPDGTGVPVEETWGAMAELQDAGLVRAIGVSNFDRQLIERCEPIRHVDSLQQEFSMLQLRDRELIRWCGEHGTGVVSYGPLAFGLLTGAIGPETTFAPGDFRGPGGEVDELFGPGNRDRSLAVVDAVHPIAERLDATVAQVALAWNVAQPGVTAAIAGSRSPEHARANAGAGDLELDDATLAELETVLSLGPG